MKLTIWGIARSPGGSGWLEVKDIRENRDLVSRELTGVFYSSREVGARATHQKNVDEAFRVVATIRASDLDSES